MRKLLATVAVAMVLAVGLWLAVTAGASPAQSTTGQVKTATLTPLGIHGDCRTCHRRGRTLVDEL